MLFATSIRRGLRLSTLLVTLASATACDDDDPVEPDDEPKVAAMRLTVGDETYNVAGNGVVTPSPVTILLGSTAISAAFLREDGQVEDRVTSEEFEFQVVPQNQQVLTFTRTGALEGALNGLQAGQTTAQVSLFHLEEQHDDFGPFTVPLIVGP